MKVGRAKLRDFKLMKRVWKSANYIMATMLCGQCHCILVAPSTTCMDSNNYFLRPRGCFHEEIGGIGTYVQGHIYFDSGVMNRRAQSSDEAAFHNYYGRKLGPSQRRQLMYTTEQGIYTCSEED